jgi:uncharacterized membrane protein
MDASAETLSSREISDREYSDRQRLQTQSRDVEGALPRNVGSVERIASASAGAILILKGLARRDLAGLVAAGIGGALAFRGATGHCSVYQALDVNTATPDERDETASARGTRVTQSFLINKSAEELYAYWRNFENLPKIMTHLESVRDLGNGRSHWIATAPSIVGGKVEWDAEIIADEPNARIAWRAPPGGDVEHRGSIMFTKAPGDRGTKVRVVLEYHPPAGKVGRWIAKIFGEEPEQQIREDLRNFKRMMEVGEVLTLIGQPHGTCTGRGKRYTESGADGRQRLATL